MQLQKDVRYKHKENGKVYEFGYMLDTGYAIMYSVVNRSAVTVWPDKLEPASNPSHEPKQTKVKKPQCLINYHEVLDILNKHDKPKEQKVIVRIKDEIEKLEKFKS